MVVESFRLTGRASVLGIPELRVSLADHGYYFFRLDAIESIKESIDLSELKLLGGDVLRKQNEKGLLVLTQDDKGVIANIISEDAAALRDPFLSDIDGICEHSKIVIESQPEKLDTIGKEILAMFGNQILDQKETFPTDFETLAKNYIVLESTEDQLFLESVVKKVKNKTLSQLRYLVNVASKTKQLAVVESHFLQKRMSVKMVKDIDSDKPKDSDKSDPFKDLENYLESYDVKREATTFTNVLTQSVIKGILMGLPEDKDLSGIGIRRHMMEDYLLKLIALDSAVRSRIGFDLSSIKKRVNPFGNAVSLDSSKIVLDMAASLAGFEDEEHIIREIVNTASVENVRLVTKEVLEQILS